MPSSSAGDAVIAQAQTPHPLQVRYQLYAQAADAGWDFDLHQQAGDFAYAIGDLDAATAHWQAALFLQPDQVNLTRQLAEMHLMLHAWTPAIDALRALLVLSPDDPWAHYHLGLLLAPLHPTQAAHHLQQAANDGHDAEVANALLAAVQTSSPYNAFNVGLILAQYGLWAQAERAFRAADVLYPNDAITWAHIGVSRTMQGKAGEPWLDAAEAQAPDDATVHYLRGISWRQQRDYVKSLEAFTLALQADALNPAYYAEIGATYQQQRNLGAAEYWLRQALTLSDSASEFRTVLAAFYREEAAELDALGVASPQPLTPTVDDHVAVALSLYQLSYFEEARRYLQMAQALEADNPQVLFLLAQMALHDQEVELAQALLAPVIALSPDFSAEAQALLDGIERVDDE